MKSSELLNLVLDVPGVESVELQHFAGGVVDLKVTPFAGCSEVAIWQTIRDMWESNPFFGIQLSVNGYDIQGSGPSEDLAGREMQMFDMHKIVEAINKIEGASFVSGEWCDSGDSEGSRSAKFVVNYQFTETSCEVRNCIASFLPKGMLFELNGVEFKVIGPKPDAEKCAPLDPRPDAPAESEPRKCVVCGCVCDESSMGFTHLCSQICKQCLNVLPDQICNLALGYVKQDLFDGTSLAYTWDDDYDSSNWQTHPDVIKRRREADTLMVDGQAHQHVFSFKSNDTPKEEGAIAQPQGGTYTGPWLEENTGALSEEHWQRVCKTVLDRGYSSTACVYVSPDEETCGIELEFQDEQETRIVIPPPGEGWELYLTVDAKWTPAMVDDPYGEFTDEGLADCGLKIQGIYDGEGDLPVVHEAGRRVLAEYFKKLDVVPARVLSWTIWRRD